MAGGSSEGNRTATLRRKVHEKLICTMVSWTAYLRCRLKGEVREVVDVSLVGRHQLRQRRDLTAN
jgi:hypothetical protein